MTLESLESIKEYKMIRHEDLNDIHARGYLMRHNKSGARVVLIDCDDENKVFNIAFRTPPEKSTGVAHIIEHTVLCGSKKFPLKDPFVELVKGSLNTFLNAITYPDKTMFPVASTNDKDFQNLMHVYLDAVFYPNIYREEKIFRQEGWNYELNDPEDPITLNGVVYNEMKGVYSSSDEMLDRYISDELFPDTTYGVDSGGDPDVIPTLSYEEFLDFHRTYYHPSNSYIYLYGNLDMAAALSWIDDQYLKNFDAVTVNSEINKQQAFDEEKKVVKHYAVSDDEPVDGNTFLSLNIVCGSPFDIKESIAFDVLDYALFSAPGAPIKEALLDAGVGKDIYGSYNDGIRQPYFSVTARNADPSDAEQFEEIVRGNLADIADNGVDQSSLMAGLNYLEFQFREADFGQFPKGLMYSIDVFDSWLYDDDQPFNALKQLDTYAELRSEINKGYFENLIRDKLLNNPHALMLVMKPARGLNEEREIKLEQTLRALKESLGEAEIREMVKSTKELREYQERQETPEALATLPVLLRSDIKRESVNLKNTELSLAMSDGTLVPVIYHDISGNGIAYLSLLWRADTLPLELVPYLGLLKNVFMSVDTGAHSYMELNNEINKLTGGITCEIPVFNKESDPAPYEPFFSVNAKMLNSNTKEAFRLIREMITTSDLSDEKRIYEVIASVKAQLQTDLQQSGNSAAAQRANAYYSSSAAFNDATGGIGFYHFIKQLEEHYEEKKAVIRESLSTLIELLFRNSCLTVSFGSDREGLEILKEHFGDISCPGNEKSPLRTAYMQPLGRLNEGFITSGQVQFAAMAGSFKDAGLTYKGTTLILRHLLSYEYLWQNVRVTGGAYGCGASFRRNGESDFSSYRDPHFKRTIDIFKSVPGYLETFSADEKEMTKYIIGTISGIDTPLTPSLLSSVSMRAYMNGITMEDMNRSRAEILDASEQDIRELANHTRAVADSNYICVIGSKSVIEKDRNLLNSVQSLL